MTPVLPAFYFGSVEHYALLARHPQIIIDIGEHYARQSYRTRTGIVGPNGPQHLSVQVEHDHGKKMPMCEVELSYTETWPQQHLHAIRSAYGQTPWFIHYIDEIEAVLLKKYDRLVDLNMATIALGLTKFLVHRGLGMSLDQHMADEGFAMELAARSNDFKEAGRALRDKRKPDFQGL